MMEFNLWDIEVGKQLGHFTDEAEALAMVRKLVDNFGEAYAGELGLGRRTADGAILEPLSGDTLLARVDEVVPRQTLVDERRAVVTG
jgi:hypothetical protein